MVQWNFDQGDGVHDVTSGVRGSPDGAFASGPRSSGSFSYAFAVAGVFPYHCQLHANMNGVITVTGAHDGGVSTGLIVGASVAGVGVAGLIAFKLCRSSKYNSFDSDSFDSEVGL